jgi:eukaryotic-like serine/threonine-protein kinase
MKTCKNCNNNLPAYLKYCPICGKKQNDLPPKVRPEVLILLATGFIGGAIVLSLVFENTQNPTPTPVSQNTLPRATTQTSIVSKTPASFASPTITPSLVPPATRTIRPSTLAAEKTLLPAVISPTSASAGKVSNSDKMVMVFIPGGEFIMGSSSGDADENPPHSVYLNPFWIDQTEVTNAMYALCIQAQRCSPPKKLNSFTRGDYYTNSGYGDFPVVYVEWSQAKTYCDWAGRRLPTEAEWEKAARGTDGRAYPWGDSISCSHAQYQDCGDDTVRVGSFPAGASPYGVLDMAGNVWEWVADWYQENYYSHSPSDNPMGPGSGNYKVMRGGSWYSEDFHVRTASRRWESTAMSFSSVGIRCAYSE